MDVAVQIVNIFSYQNNQNNQNNYDEWFTAIDLSS